jgi:hypothetical protein
MSMLLWFMLLSLLPFPLLALISLGREGEPDTSREK